MVFYVSVTGVDCHPPAAPSSDVFEKFEGTPVSPPSASHFRNEAEFLTVRSVDGIRLFRTQSEDHFAVRRAHGHVLPVQRTMALLLLGVPCKVSTDQLQSFLGDNINHVEALRVLQRDTSCDDVEDSVTGQARSLANFYTVVILCRTQDGADALYEETHGRIFHANSIALLGNSSPALSCSTNVAEGGPCCYLVFVEVVVYHCSPQTVNDAEQTVVPHVPSAAYELPACPFCLELLDISGSGMVTHNQGWLSWLPRCHPASTACCPACPIIAAATNTAGHQCQWCEKTEEIWVCLICGHLGCGRYAQGHAKDHAMQRRHRFCFEFATGRIWDYSGDVFVHRRLVEPRAASGMIDFEVALPAPAGNSTQDSSKLSWGGQEETLAMELEAILVSQLDYQRSLYEAGLADIRLSHAEEIAVEHARLGEEEEALALIFSEVDEAERRRKTLERQAALTKKAGVEASKRLQFEKELNLAFIANRQEIQASTDTAAEGANREDQSDQMIVRLKQRVADLMEAISASETDSGSSSTKR